MAGGGQIGNQNAAKKDQLSRMLLAALEENNRARLHKGIQAVAKAFGEGERWAIEFAFERIDGRLKQSIVVETGSTEAQRVSLVTSLITEVAGLQADGGNAGLGATGLVVSTEIPATAH